MEDKKKKKVRLDRDIITNIINIKTLVDILAAKGVIKDQKEWDVFREKTIAELKNVYDFERRKKE